MLIPYELEMAAADSFFFFQAEDGIRDLVRSRGLGDVYKRQVLIDGDGETKLGTGVQSAGAARRIVRIDGETAQPLSLIHI